MPSTAKFGDQVKVQTGSDPDHRFRMLQSMARSHQQNPQQSVTAGVWQALQFDVNDLSTDGMRPTTMNDLKDPNKNTKFTAPFDGTYLLIGGCNVPVAVNGLGVRKNGMKNDLPTGAQTSNLNGNQAVVTDVQQLVKGDVIEFVLNPSGGLLLAPNSAATFGAMIYVGE